MDEAPLSLVALKTERVGAFSRSSARYLYPSADPAQISSWSGCDGGDEHGQFSELLAHSLLQARSVLVVVNDLALVERDVLAFVPLSSDN
jgi:hypothetical protein